MLWLFIMNDKFTADFLTQLWSDDQRINPVLFVIYYTSNCSYNDAVPVFSHKTPQVQALSRNIKSRQLLLFNSFISTQPNGFISSSESWRVARYKNIWSHSHIYVK